MNEELLFKIVKMTLKASFKVVKFSLGLILAVLGSDDLYRNINARRKWIDGYNDYSEAFSKRKSS
jgi:hypothetical protein